MSGTGLQEEEEQQQQQQRHQIPRTPSVDSSLYGDDGDGEDEFDTLCEFDGDYILRGRSNSIEGSKMGRRSEIGSNDNSDEYDDEGDNASSSSSVSSEEEEEESTTVVRHRQRQRQRSQDDSSSSSSSKSRLYSIENGNVPTVWMDIVVPSYRVRVNRLRELLCVKGEGGKERVELPVGVEAQFYVVLDNPKVPVPEELTRWTTLPGE